MQHSVFNLVTSCELARAIIIIPIVQMVKLRLREVRELAQDHSWEVAESGFKPMSI